MFSSVKHWNSVRRDVLDQFRSVVEAQVPAQGATPIAKTEAVCNIVNQLAEMAAGIFSYLALNFDEKARGACCSFHHNWMLENLSAENILQILKGSVNIWSEVVDGHKYIAGIHIERFVSREGELTLDLFFDGKMVCAGSFSVLPAATFGMEGGEVLLLTRLQGGKDRIDEIRLATRLMSDVAPRAVVFALLTGVARAVGVDRILGVSGENYIEFLPAKREALQRQYDDFFASLEAVGPQDGFYVYDIGAPRKPLNALKVGHRVRTRRKRELKDKLSDAAMASFSSWLARKPEPSSGGG